MQANARVIKNYRHKLLDAMTSSIKESFESHYTEYQHDMLGYLDTLGWIYKDIIPRAFACIDLNFDAASVVATLRTSRMATACRSVTVRR
jgi:hypothetical protein